MISRQKLLQLLAHRPVRYVLVGGWNTLVGYGLFAGFYAVGRSFRLQTLVASELALIIANTLCVIQAYYLYKYLVFRTPHRSWVEFFRFASVYAVQLAANLVTLPLLIAWLHVDPRVGQAVVIPLFVLLTYLAHHHISFKHRKPPAQKESN